MKITNSIKHLTNQSNNLSIYQSVSFTFGFLGSRLGVNRTYEISLTAMDEDDDAIHCRLSKYVEAGSAITTNPITNTSVDKVCTVLYTRKRKNPLINSLFRWLYQVLLEGLH